VSMIREDVHASSQTPAVVCRYCNWYGQLVLVDGGFQCRDVERCLIWRDKKKELRQDRKQKRRREQIRR